MKLESRALVIGTRGSQLAVWQAEHVAGRLQEASPGVSVRLERIRTTGDKILEVPLAQVGGKALFVKEIEEALLAGRVDLAVHSMKDVPTDLPAGLAIAAIPLRESPADVLISRTGRRLADLPRGARVGTSSLRRQAQLLHHRPDLVVVGLRGNLDTRIRKLSSEGLDAIVLAAAGIKRLGLERLVTEVLPPEIVLPAIGQGALGIEIRVPGAGCRVPGAEADEPRGAGRESGEPHVAEMVQMLDHRETHLAVRAERAMLRRLGGGCQVPIAALATVEEGRVFLRGLIAGTDGTTAIRGETWGTAAEPDGVGRALAETLLDRGGLAILKDILGGDVRG
ncbi:MAG: hydroxymethylbilane synthase [candidate division NC10 bacterium RBG_16_65_8]|nr:MAG: hydroxymethylbilane synthase [candidate division NC10 bacterium RBG_16_65_8]